MKKMIQIGTNESSAIDAKVTKKEVNEIKRGKMLELIKSLHPDKVNFSIAETAAIINVSYDFVRDKIKEGLIHAVKYGDRNMISLFELARILTEGV